MRDLAEKLDGLSTFEHLYRVVDDMSFVIEIDCSRLFRGRIPVDDHEIVVEKRRAVYCRGVVRVIFSDQDLLLHVWYKRKPPRSLAWFSTPIHWPIRTCNASQPCSFVDCSEFIGPSPSCDYLRVHAQMPTPRYPRTVMEADR